MSKAAHNIPPKRLSVEIRKTIALDAVANTISSAARQHQVTNKTAARHRNKALEAINQTFDKHNKKSDGHLFESSFVHYLKSLALAGARSGPCN